MDHELYGLFSAALKAGLGENELRNAAGISKKVVLLHEKPPFNKRKFIVISVIVAVLFAAKTPQAIVTPILYTQSVFAPYMVTKEDACIVGLSASVIEVTRSIANCSMCKGIKEVPVIENMTQEYFLKHHAYTGVPVLIKGATRNWTALDVFSYQYFKKLYTKLEALEENEELGCQFFPYKTNIYSLRQLFSMSKKRAALKKDQWYVGWSNCVPRVMKVLRKHYQKPSFLPDDSEASNLDWLFMGGSGIGADMHIDAVDRPSWQAMIKGRKTWTIRPPVECERFCHGEMSATMEPGDILIVDTNKWFHSTFIHPGELSITIGSEYD